MGWPIVRRGPGGNAFHVDSKWDVALGLDVPLMVVCDTCGAGRALSTPQAVLVAQDQAAARDPAYDPEESESVWIRQTSEFQQHHRCRTAPEARKESI